MSYAIGEALFAEVSNDKSHFGYLLRRSALLMAAAQIPAAAVVALGAGLVLRMFGGQYAANAHGLLIILACGSIAVGLYTWASYALKAARRLRHLMAGNMIYAAVIIGLAFVWAPRGLAWLGLAWTLGNLAAGVYCAIALVGTRTAAPGARSSRTGRVGLGRRRERELVATLNRAEGAQEP